MHIEPGLVDGSKILLSYATASVVLTQAARLASQAAKRDGLTSVVVRSAICAALVFCFFEVLPHHPVGVSEVHFILGTTLMLVFGVAPTALGLAVGLLAQSLFFEPQDLPQYGMNVTTLLGPLFLSALIARRVIPEQTAYVDINYLQALKLSMTYQGGIVAWVGFWALYGGGLGAENLAHVLSFGAAYMSVVCVEPLADLGVLALAKKRRQLLQGSRWLELRLYTRSPRWS